MPLRRTIHATIRPGDESGYVALCPELRAVTQGATLDDVAENLREAIALAIAGDDLSTLGLAPSPVIIVMMELQLGG